MDLKEYKKLDASAGKLILTLQNKLSRQGLCENFGQTELRDWQDKVYNKSPLQVWAKYQILEMLQQRIETLVD